MESGELRGMARAHAHSGELVRVLTGAADEIDRLTAELRECRGSLARWKAAVDALTDELEQVYSEQGQTER